VSTPLFRIDDRARPSPSLARFALGPVSLVIAFGLYYGQYISQLAAMIVVGAGLIGFRLVELLSNDARDAYDRAAVGLMAKGHERELGARFRAARAFRLFGTKAERSAREAAVLTAEGKKEEAAKAWASAVAGYANGVVPRSIALGFAGAAFDAGWDRDASRAYRALFEGDPELPRVRLRLAHALAKLGEDLEEVETLLAAEEKHGGDAAEIAEVRAAAKKASAPAKKKKRASRP
jgi:hypothetical protein